MGYSYESIHVNFFIDIILNSFKMHWLFTRIWIICMDMHTVERGYLLMKYLITWLLVDWIHNRNHQSTTIKGIMEQLFRKKGLNSTKNIDSIDFSVQ